MSLVWSIQYHVAEARHVVGVVDAVPCCGSPSCRLVYEDTMLRKPLMSFVTIERPHVVGDYKTKKYGRAGTGWWGRRKVPKWYFT